MGNIVLLDDLTINKIAAGEVIERPASVIKEMIENSIDAGATNISVEIRNGGISYIRIVDNGKGISADDLELAFERHATSKIRNADDLQTVKSMGFRGEALASIAAVANVELVSKTEEQSEGYRIVVEGGDVQTKEVAACSTGTIITVQNLFFNTPVRYKFLKKDYTESGYIEDVVSEIALIHPEIAFKFVNSGKTIIQTNGNGSLTSVIYSIYGKEVAEASIETEYTYDDILIKGVVGKPEIARSNRSRQIFFVNKRYIKDKTLSAAVSEAFKGMIPIGKFGFVVLDIELDPSKVDVNVHPAKLEVRFEDEGKVFKAIYHTIKAALLNNELVSNTSKEKEPEEVIPEIAKTEETPIHKEGRTSGLFGWKKKKKEQIDDEIEKIGERDNVISQIYNEKQKKKEDKKLDEKLADRPVDTFNVLEQLKMLQDKMQKDVENAKREIENTVKGYKTENNNYGIINVEEEKENYVLDSTEEADATKVLDTIENLNNTEALNSNEETDINEAQNTTDTDDKIEDNNNIEVEASTEENNNTEVEASTEENINTEVETSTEENTNNEIINLTEENTNTENADLTNEEQSQENELPKAIINMQNSVQEDTKIVEIHQVEHSPELKKEVEEVKSKIDEMLENTEEEMPLDFAEMYYKTFGVYPKLDRTDENISNDTKEENENNMDMISEENSVSIFEQTEEQKPQYRFIGIAFKTYIILEMNKELYMLDQHAAHERVLYEKVKNNYYNGEVEKNSQLMLLPDVITLSHKEMDIVRDNMGMFEKAGFIVEEFGENTIKLSGVPEICINLDTKELFLETLDEINSIARTAKQEIEERFIATIACKAAIKAGMTLSETEVHKLMDQLLVLPNPFTCPHGRPTAIKMTRYDLERKFARK